MSDQYDVGYGKPPKHTQWKPGRSGNPKGRPKGSRNFKTDVKDTLKEPVRLTKNGKPKTVSTQAATLMRLREKALQGDQRALDRLIELAKTYNDEELAEDTVQVGRTDADILAAYDARLLRSANPSAPSDPDEANESEETSKDSPRTKTDAPKEVVENDGYC